MAQTQENQEAQEPKKSRKIGDVFSDYKTNSNIADAIITKMNLIKKINTLNNKESIRTWLYQIAKNKWKDYLKKNKKASSG